jgi:hypothetical protein
MVVSTAFGEEMSEPLRTIRSGSAAPPMSAESTPLRRPTLDEVRLLQALVAKASDLELREDWLAETHVLPMAEWAALRSLQIQ